MVKLGFQSSKYDHLTLEQELEFSSHNEIDFFDVFFDDFTPGDIVNVQLPENFTVHFPIGFEKKSKEDMKPFLDFVNEKRPKTVTIHFSNLSYEMLEYIGMNIKNSVLCIENSIPDCNEFYNNSYIDFMVQAVKLAAEKGFKVCATYDAGHTKLNGLDACEYAKKIIDSGIEIMTLHLHDNDGHEDQHRPAGSVCNGINFPEVMALAQGFKHDVYGVIEHWNNNYNALEYLRNLIK